MKRHLKMAAQPLLQLQVLPVRVDQCPNELLRAAYPQGFTAAVPAHTTLHEVMRLAKTWPLRKTHLFATASKASSLSGSLEGGHMLQAVAAATVHAMASQMRGSSRRKNLRKFAQFCLLELGERDAKMPDPVSTLATELVGNIQQSDVLAKHCGCRSALVAQGLHHLAVKHYKGQFKILSDNAAVEVMGACKLDDNHFLLCQELTKEKQIAKGFSCWKHQSKQTPFAYFPPKPFPCVMLLRSPAFIAMTMKNMCGCCKGEKKRDTFNLIPKF